METFVQIDTIVQVVTIVKKIIFENESDKNITDFCRRFQQFRSALLCLFEDGIAAAIAECRPEFRGL